MPSATAGARRVSLWLLLATLCLPGAARTQDVQGHALVQDDGSLMINGQIVYLFGVYLPPSGRQCDTNFLPIRCTNRSVLQMSRIVKGYVYCYAEATTVSGHPSAICYVGRTTFDQGEDIGAYLVQQGWALATPEAPFEYHALEKLARAHEIGVWGWPVDSVSPPLRRGRLRH